MSGSPEFFKRAFGDTFEDLYKGTADLFLWPTLYLWEFPKPTISQIHGYCMGGGIYLGDMHALQGDGEIAGLRKRIDQIRGELYRRLTPWQRVQVARHANRPYMLDYVERLCTEFTELHGDRRFADDGAIV